MPTKAFRRVIGLKLLGRRLLAEVTEVTNSVSN